MNDDLNLYAHIIDKHTYGGYTVRVQTIERGEVDNYSTMNPEDIDEWLEAHYPQSMELHVQV